jgi:hypothetical protein
VLGFLDTILGSTLFAVTRKRCATVSLDSRFVSGVAAGPWITGRATVKKVTRTFAFVDAEAFAGDKLLVTTAAVPRVRRVTRAVRLPDGQTPDRASLCNFGSSKPLEGRRTPKTACAQNRISPAISTRDTVSSPLPQK